MEHPKPFTQTTRGKLILAFALVLCVSLFTWIVNRSAFDRINNVVEELARPNDRLQVLNQFQMGMSQINDFYRAEALQDRYKPSSEYSEQVGYVLEHLQQLKLLFANNPQQMRRLDQIDSVFSQRNLLFVKYLKTRYNYIHNGLVDRQFEELANQVDRDNLKIDSNVVTSEMKTTTYTYYNPVVKELKKPEKKRLFRRKKPEPVIETEPYVVVEENLNVHVDTLAVSQKKDSILENIRLSLDEVETERNAGRQFLQKQEIILIQSNEILFNRVLDLISQVEDEEKLNTELNAARSIQIAHETIGFTKMLTAIFILVAFVLIGFVISDVSKFNRYRKQLEASRAEAEFHSQAKQRFLSNMSHEIRTPLQAIVGYSELMLQESDYDRTKVEAISCSSEYLLQVVNEILDYSRIVSNKFSIVNNPFVIQNVLKEVSDLAAFQCQQKGVEWSFVLDSFSEKDVVVVSDAFRIKQILINVLGNAVKFTPAGSVSMKVQLKEQELRVVMSIQISDTGIGMDKSDVKRIFQQFERAGNAESATGTGLGLSIVKELIDALKGEIRVQSILGKGTSFELDLKLRKNTAVKEINLPVQAEEVIDADTVVWVVDDDPFILKLCEQLLIKKNVTHRCFDDPKKLLNAEWDERVKVLFADVRMPGMSGVELCRQLRIRGHKSVQIIALTAQVLPEDKAGFLNNGFDAIVLKPFKSHEFYAPIIAFSRKEQLKFDVSDLRKMIPDNDDFEAIRLQFIRDSQHDLMLIQAAIKKKDEKELLLFIHRLAGRFSQMGARYLGKELRLIESQLKEGMTDEVVEKLNQLIPLLEKAVQAI